MGEQPGNPPTTEPRGCPMPGACSAIVEISRLRAGFMRAMQTINQCAVSGIACQSGKCGCEGEIGVWCDG